MLSALHILWISLKGLLIFVVVIATMIGTTGLLFGWDTKASEAVPGIIGGGILMFATVFVALMVLLPTGARP